jgi:hypothetical protein
MLGKIEDYLAKLKTKSEPIRANTSVLERKGREEKRKREMGKKMCG